MQKLTNNRLRLLSAVYCCCALGCEAPQSAENQTLPSIVEQITKEAIPALPVVLNPEPSNENALTKEILGLRLRLLEAYTKYWPLLSLEFQHDQLPNVLDDPIQELRIFGIERVAVLLRDGESTEEELQLVVDRLRDSKPEVRRAAAKLLPEINLPGLSEHVAQSLAIESDLQVATQELIFFLTRPHPSAIEPVVERLELGPIEPAADALIVLLSASDVTEVLRRRIVRIVQRTRVTNNLPSLITLEAMLGNKRVQRSLIPLLDSPIETIRFAVAQGFASSGFAEPLILRASNNALYAYALAALQKKGGIESFEDLMNLYVVDEPSWSTAVFAIATALDTNSLLHADEILEGIQAHALRLSILKSVWDVASERTLSARKAIARRAVPLMIDNGDAVGALQLLDVFGESLIDEDMLALRFSAAIAASAWDTAADVRPQPKYWITAWQSFIENDPATATVIRQQIIQRFSNQLTDAQRKSLSIEQEISTPN